MPVVVDEWIAHLTIKQEVCISNPTSHLYWKMHVGRWLVAMLCTGKGVTPEVNLRECISHLPLPGCKLGCHSGFKTQRRHHHESKKGHQYQPRGDISIIPKQGYQWPHKWTYVRLLCRVTFGIRYTKSIERSCSEGTQGFSANYTFSKMWGFNW